MIFSESILQDLHKFKSLLGNPYDSACLKREAHYTVISYGKDIQEQCHNNMLHFFVRYTHI
jgi:hypothetical protein